ncbi:type II toxin-antitoxin system RelE/ParE family toxin [Candidatus Micrarchaeota archaeon]|nr:type II toxin-antitoxin system RelE/ParE family toxin [Candidatus Micrarchaeota archaeon]
MSDWEIRLSNNAEKFLKKLKLRTDLEKLLKALAQLKEGPFVRKYKKLEGTYHRYRMRMGNYRVTYETFENEKVIVILEIGHRENIYD